MVLSESVLVETDNLTGGVEAHCPRDPDTQRIVNCDVIPGAVQKPVSRWRNAITSQIISDDLTCVVDALCTGAERPQRIVCKLSSRSGVHRSAD